MKIKRKVIKVLATTMNDAGWVTLMYFWWVSLNDVGIFLSLILIVVSDLILLD